MALDGIPMRRLTALACFLCFGFWQLGQGAYIPAKAWVAQELMQKAWRRAESGEDRARPWPWADTYPIARLAAKGGEIDLIVLEGESDRTLAFAPGHLSASVLPGDIGNAVIAGHRDTHFQFLQYVTKGESILIETAEGRMHVYQVTGIDVVDSRRGSLVLDTDEAMLSLVTCYPFSAAEADGPMRYVVSARMVPE